jgi:hypothetical protein
VKRRNPQAQTERDGVNAAATAANRLGLIWRDLLQEDVGIDATIELVLEGYPTGKLVAAQVKSGTSYMQNETQDSFCFRPKVDDFEYWQSVIIPVILVFYDPRNDALYWVDVKRDVADRGSGLGDDPPRLCVPKTNVFDESFVSYLKGLFDLAAYTEEEYKQVTKEFRSNVYSDESVAGAVRVSSLDLFIAGLWGLCSKVQFHLALLSEEIRKRLATRSEPSMLTYDFSHAKLFPFIMGYLSSLTRHRLATLDTADLNETLYGRLEWPAFIAPLTLNGRKYVEHLRAEIGDQYEVCDHQHLTFRLCPHTQIEIYSSFEQGPPARFGPFTDVIPIRFNRYLDYYRLLHLRRLPGDRKVKVIADQSIHYYALTDYLKNVFEKTLKDNVVCRNQDMVISPLICWLEKYLDFRVGINPTELAVTPVSERFASYDEFQSFFSRGATAFQVSEEVLFDLRFLRLANGESLADAELDRARRPAK